MKPNFFWRMRHVAFAMTLVVVGLPPLSAQSNVDRPKPTVIEKILGAKAQGVALPDISVVVNAVGSLNGLIFTNAKGKPDLY
ncbi:MAG: hypothetical protein JNM63_06820, partial [Spirochaetia bacterium]|nr:hypothetical protein [Spirochaetia bacterium]